VLLRKVDRQAPLRLASPVKMMACHTPLILVKWVSPHHQGPPRVTGMVRVGLGVQVLLLLLLVVMVVVPVHLLLPLVLLLLCLPLLLLLLLWLVVAAVRTPSEGWGSSSVAVAVCPCQVSKRREWLEGAQAHPLLRRLLVRVARIEVAAGKDGGRATSQEHLHPHYRHQQE
jgi:hypothetical protein